MATLNASQTSVWNVGIHDRGHFIHLNTGPYVFGIDYSYMRFPSDPYIDYVYRVIELSKDEVRYLPDDRSKCEPKTRRVDLGICVQEHVQESIGCRMPWMKEGPGT